MKSPFGQVEARASTQWLQGVSCSPWSSLSSDPGCLDPLITMSTVCSFSLFFSISLHTSFFPRPHSFFFTSRLFPHVPPLPYFPLSLLIFFDFFRSLPPPNCRSHFLLLPLTCSQWTNVDVIVWVLELHLHPIRLKGGAFCSNGRWESVWQWPLSAGIRRIEYCKQFQKRRESTNWWFSTWKSDPCTGLLIFQGCIVKPQIEHQNKEKNVI